MAGQIFKGFDDNGMAYIKIKKSIKSGESKKQTIMDFRDVTLVFDVDKDNKLLGIELMRKEM